MLVDGYDHHIAPARIEPRLPARGDGGMLRVPERLGIGKIGVLPEKVRHDGKAACRRVEQGMADRNGLSAKKPCLQLMPGRRIAVLVIQQGDRKSTRLNSSH